MCIRTHLASQHPSLGPRAHELLSRSQGYLSSSHTWAPLGAPETSPRCPASLSWPLPSSPAFLSLSMLATEGYLALAEKAEANGDEGNK